MTNVQLAKILARGREAMDRMAGDVSNDDYLDAASNLADAFRDLDQLLTAKK